MITNLVDKQSYAGNGSNVNFGIPFTVVVNDINETGVILRDITVPSSPVDTLLVYGAGQDYVLTGASLPTQPFNNNVQLKVAPTANQIVVVYRVMPLTQLLNMITNGFDFSNLNQVHDRIVAMLQVVAEIAGRCPQLAFATQRSSPDYIPEPQANTFLGYDSNKKLNLFYNAQAVAVGIATWGGINGTLSNQTDLQNALNAKANLPTIPETTFTIANNQSAAANVTGLLFSGATIRSAEIDVQFYINTTSTGATEMSARAKYQATYKTVAAAWDLTPLGVSGDVDASGNPAGVTLSITSAGQVQYTSGNTSGTAASSLIHFKASTMGV
jgi:hypothetical protein